MPGGEPLTPLEPLFRDPGLPGGDLPAGLAALYGGGIGLEGPCLYANFVGSVDGVVALGEDVPSVGGVISGGSAADRFVMSLLRGCADAVLIGAGTLRGSPGHRWTAEHVHPDGAAEVAALRAARGLSPSPPLHIVTRSGDIDPGHTGLLPGTVVLTGDRGAAALAGRLPHGVEVRSLGADPGIPDAVGAIRDDGHDAILTEGGPSVMGALVAAGLLDELFLTTSPALFGRARGDHREGLVEGVLFDGNSAPALTLRSLHRHGSHLFARYAIGRR